MGWRRPRHAKMQLLQLQRKLVPPRKWLVAFCLLQDSEKN